MNASENENHAHKSEDDGLSALLRMLDIEGRVYFNAKVCGNWRLTERTVGATCFHVATTGSFMLDVPGVFHGVLGVGDLAIFPRELAHSMSPVAPGVGEQRILEFRLAREVEGTGLICGEFNFLHPASRHVLDALPEIVLIRFDPGNYWLRAMLDMIIGENMNGGAASSVLLDKLSELLFSYALRQHVSSHPENSGVLALYTHRRLGKAVAALHRAPDRNWTLAELASVSGMSRTSFAEAFRQASGWTPVQYLTWWRMQLAWSLLRQGATVGDAAARVGYNSEAAFSRAFQRVFAEPAGQVRRQGIAALASPNA